MVLRHRAGRQKNKLHAAKEETILCVCDLHCPFRKYKQHTNMYRTNTCGELRISDAGKEVTLAGWVQRSRKMGGMALHSWSSMRLMMLPSVAKPTSWDANTVFR